MKLFAVFTVLSLFLLVKSPLIQSSEFRFTLDSLLKELDDINRQESASRSGENKEDEDYTEPYVPPSKEEAEEQLRKYCKQSPMNLPCLTSCLRNHRGCGTTYYNYTDTPVRVRRVIVKMINKMRTHVAHGDGGTGFPTARAMHAVSYDRECEFFAGCFLKSCANRDSHVKIALDGTHLGSAGFGVVSFNTTVDVQRDRFAVHALNGWHQSCHGPSSWHMTFERVANVEKVHRDLQPNFANDYLHMYHENTTHIGCAIYPRNLSSYLMFLQLYCVFKPGVPLGRGFQLYNIGKAAEGCAARGLSKHEKYPALCGEMRSLDDDKFVPFIDMNFSSLTSTPNINLLLLAVLILRGTWL